MDPADLRTFLHDYYYDTPLALMTDAVNSGPSKPFVEWTLALRSNRRTKRKLDEFKAAITLPRKPCWFNWVSQNVFWFWRHLRLWACPTLSVPYNFDNNFSTRVRAAVAPLGVAKRSVPPIASLAKSAAQAIWRQMENRPHVVWMDNWYRKRFVGDPSRGNLSLNVTAIPV